MFLRLLLFNIKAFVFPKAGPPLSWRAGGRDVCCGLSGWWSRAEEFFVRCHARRALQMQRESAVTELRRWRKMYRRGYGQAGFASWRRAFLTLSMCEPVKGPRGRSSDDSAIIVVKSRFRQQQQQQRQSVQRRALGRLVCELTDRLLWAILCVGAWKRALVESRVRLVVGL